MTEDEAKTKTCPLFAINPNEGTCNCVASDCMAWRELPAIDRDTEKLMSESAISAVHKMPRKGFCGLAGKL